MSAARKKRRPASRRDTPNEREARVIRACVTYAQCLAASEGGFEADPSGDSEFAAPGGGRYLDRARLQLAALCNTKHKALTFRALEAKARVMILVMDSAERSELDHIDKVFLKFFAAELKEFLNGAARDADNAAVDAANAKQGLPAKG